MPKRVRDHKAIYARRKERAIREGYKGYHQKRKTHEHVVKMVEHFMNRIDTTGYDWDDLSVNDPEYWIWFRVNYGEGVGVA